jgi:hypothetical protein
MKYLQGYPDALREQVQQLITDGQLGAVLLKKYPQTHEVRTDKALYDYVMDLKTVFCAIQIRCHAYFLTTSCR